MSTKRGSIKEQAATSIILTEAERIDLIADILLELALTGDGDGNSSST